MFYTLYEFMHLGVVTSATPCDLAIIESQV